MPGTVLIVDDNARFRVRARRLLEAAGYTVVAEAADGATALEAARRHRPMVVLLDIGLPDTSGLSVAEQLARGRDAPSVVLDLDPRPQRLRGSDRPLRGARLRAEGGAVGGGARRAHGLTWRPRA